MTDSSPLLHRPLQDADAESVLVGGFAVAQAAGLHGLDGLRQLPGSSGILRNPGTPQGFAFALGPVHPGLDALCDEIAFQLGIGDRDVVHHFAHRTGRVQPGLLVTLQPDPPVFQLFQSLGGV